MLPKDFVSAYFPFALETQRKTGISAIAILAQAALESGWGERAPGNMFFGVKDSDGLNGNEQLVRTVEYLSRPDAKFPVVLSVTKVGPRRWKYIVKDYFRKYDSPEGSFTHHAELFLKAPRYAKALAVGANPFDFFREIAAAGYATAPDYFKVLTAVARMIQKFLPNAPSPNSTGQESLHAEEEEIPVIDEETVRLWVPVRRKRRRAQKSSH
ncbi:MAG TPA: glucosaminidase domain-containing protein [Saprospiraceae bacterium]|nr:glucosaminidase domain-containing protein [Saprospiraceae bacterium]